MDATRALAALSAVAAVSAAAISALNRWRPREASGPWSVHFDDPQSCFVLTNCTRGQARDVRLTEQGKASSDYSLVGSEAWDEIAKGAVARFYAAIPAEVEIPVVEVRWKSARRNKDRVWSTQLPHSGWSHR